MLVEAAVGLGLLLGLYMLIYHNFVKGPKCQNKTSLRGKTVLLTGGNTGIGKATALDLARRGARVVLACRSPERGEAAVSDIRRESGSNEVLFMSLDLASLSSVRAFAEAFLRSEPRLDILINNAGVTCVVGKSKDGFDVTFQVNHLGHFLLTHLLLDRLKHCAPSRVVVVTSLVHPWGKIDFRSIHKPVKGHLGAFQSYFNSKLANLLHVRELAKRLEGTNVTCYAVHPERQVLLNCSRSPFVIDGLLLTLDSIAQPWRASICGTEGGPDTGGVHTKILRNYPTYLRYPITAASWLFFRDPENGAQTSIYCVTQEGIEKYSGCYFENCRKGDPNPRARDDALARKLWEFSERLLGITP